LGEGQDLPLDKNDEIADLKVHLRQNQEDLQILRLDMNRQEYLLQVLNDNVEKQNDNVEKQNDNVEKQIQDLKSENVVFAEKFKKLSVISIGMTLEEYEKEYEKCSRNGNYFDQYKGNCFLYEVLPERNWNDAKTACEAKNGVLASIHSEEEWQFAKGILTSSGVSVWLGASDSATEDTWVWTDGSPVTYTDWEISQPNGGTSYNCLSAFSGYNWQWYSGDCTWTNYAVCKISA